MESIDRINKLLNSIEITPHNKKEIEGAKRAISEGDFTTALSIIQSLNRKSESKKYKGKKVKTEEKPKEDKKEIKDKEDKEDEEEDLSIFLPLGDDIPSNIFPEAENINPEPNIHEEDNDLEEDNIEENTSNVDDELDDELEDEYEEEKKFNKIMSNKKEEKEEEFIFETEKDKEKYPVELQNIELEKVYIGLLLTKPKYIVRYYILFDQCYFESESLLNIYKSILFTEGGNYTPEIAKQKFNFSREVEGIYQQKYYLKQYVAGKNYNMEKVYTDLRKICLLRKKYIEMPIESIQKKIVERQKTQERPQKM